MSEDHTFTGHDDVELTFGGSLLLDINFYNPAYNSYDGNPYRLGGTGYVGATINDEYGNRLDWGERNNKCPKNGTIDTKDTTNTSIPGSYVDNREDIRANYQSPTDNKNAGTWHATFSITLAIGRE